MHEDAGTEVVNDQAEQDAAPAESTAAETVSPDGSQEPKLKAVINDSGEIQRVPVDESDDESDEEPGDDKAENEKPKRGLDARKEQLSHQRQAISEESEMIRSMIAENKQAVAEMQQLRAELASLQQANNQAGQQSIPSVDEIMQMENPETGDFYTAYEAQLIVNNLQLEQRLNQMESQRQADEYQAQVNESVSGLAADSERTLRDFPVFDSESDQFDPELTAEAERILQDALIYDQQTGEVIGSSISVYQLHKALYEAAQGSVEARQRQQQAARQQAEAEADYRGSGQRMQKTFAKMSVSEKEAYLRRKGHDI